jgi:hypothetical protein
MIPTMVRMWWRFHPDAFRPLPTTLRATLRSISSSSSSFSVSLPSRCASSYRHSSTPTPVVPSRSSLLSSVTSLSLPCCPSPSPLLLSSRIHTSTRVTSNTKASVPANTVSETQKHTHKGNCTDKNVNAHLEEQNECTTNCSTASESTSARFTLPRLLLSSYQDGGHAPDQPLSISLGSAVFLGLCMGIGGFVCGQLMSNEPLSPLLDPLQRALSFLFSSSTSSSSSSSSSVVLVPEEVSDLPSPR